MAILAPAGLIIAVLGSIFFGIATPTEAAGVGAFGATVLAWFNSQLSLSVLKSVLRETSRTTAYIFAIFIGAAAYSLVLRGLGGDALIADILHGLPFSATGIIIAILVFVFVLGFFLDWIEITLIVLPLVSPVVLTLGFDPVWFTVLFAVCLQTSFHSAGRICDFLYERRCAAWSLGPDDLSWRRSVYFPAANWSHLHLFMAGHSPVVALSSVLSPPYTSRMVIVRYASYRMCAPKKCRKMAHEMFLTHHICACGAGLPYWGPFRCTRR